MANNLELSAATETYIPSQTFTLDFHTARLTEHQFEELCRNNHDLKFEMSATGELIIMPPTSLESGWRNTALTAQTYAWAKQDNTGIVFDSSTLFTLPNGAKRSPHVSWLTREKWDAISASERRKFSRVVPDFVIELLSPSDNLSETQTKMREYIENGVRLGWLIDPEKKCVEIYRADGTVEVLGNPATVGGEEVLRGFELNVKEIWQDT